MLPTKLFLILLSCVVLGAVAKLQPEDSKNYLFGQNALLIIALAIPFCLCLLQSKEFVKADNKAVVITGCDSGFGHSLAIRLHKLGYTVYACCLFSQQEGAKGLRKIGGSRMHVLQVDVTSEVQIREATEYVKSTLGNTELWALVNNAGIASYAEIEWCAVNVFQRIMDVNVIGVVRMTKSFLPLLRTSKGRVINVASLSGRYTLPAFAAYSMSKVACIAFSDGLRQEMSKFGIKVITVEPGLYRTPIAFQMMAESKKRWDDTPTEIKDAYGEEYFAGFIDLLKFQMNRARENVEEVVDLMIEAVTTTHPHIRYVPYWVTKIRSTILMHLPSVIRDKLFRLYSVRVEPRCMHSSP